LEAREIGRLLPAERQDQMANNAQSFKAPQCKKRLQDMGAAAQKMGCSEFIRILAATSLAAAQNNSECALLSQHREACRHELDKFRAPVAAIGSEFHATFSRVNNLLWPGIACANDAFRPSYGASGRSAAS
jgi:hypothetical protein